MIKQYFGLKKIPFSKELDTKDIFISNSMKELFSRLEHIKQTRGLLLLTGEPGAGKTLALRKFITDLNPNCYFPVYTPLSTVSEMEFYRNLCFKLTGELFYHKWKCFNRIQKAITDSVTDAKKVPVLVIDEAQLLKSQHLFEIQILLNFDIDSTQPVIFILAGQTPLREILSRPVHNSVNQRFTLKYNFTPLEKEEVKKYLLQQLQCAGLHNNELFSDSAIEAIFSNTGGNPRIVGNLALKAMTLAAIEKKTKISEEEIYQASKEL